MITRTRTSARSGRSFPSLARLSGTMRAISFLLLLVSMFGTALAERAPRQQKRGEPPAPVRHDTTFKSVPGTKLEIRAVEYNGSTNGTLTVQVKNTQKTAQKFIATGLYFVPE